MFTAYFYKTLNIEDACNQFIQKNIKEKSAKDILSKISSFEFIDKYLLNKDYLDGEILNDEEHTIIFINNFISSFTIEDLNLYVELELFS